MSRKFTLRNFYGGMNNVNPAHLLADDQAALIRNLKLDENGTWVDINAAEVVLDLSSTFFANVVKIFQWMPAQVPADCVDSVVYIVFYESGDAKMVYRGTDTGTIYTLTIKARIMGTGSYLAVLISDITVDVDSAATSGTTPATAAGGVARRYLSETEVVATAAATGTWGVYDIGFYRWLNFSTGAILSFAATLEATIMDDKTVVAEYVILPYIRIEDVDGSPITDLGDFYAIVGATSEVKSYFVGGIGLEHNLYIYPPEDFEISDDEENWYAYDAETPYSITAENASSVMTEIFVRYAPPEEA